jgi:hypothetical protein
MSRRSVTLAAVAILASGLLTGCARSEDSTFTDPGISKAEPVAVNDAPMVVPFPTRQDNAVRTNGSNGAEG